MKLKGAINVHSLLPSFKEGIKILSQAHWISISRLPISLASFLGVAGLILAFRDTNKLRSLTNFSWFSESQILSDKSWVVPGLQNLGNNCFLNVTLQALASCSSFRIFLERVVDEFEALPENQRNGDMPLAVSLNALLQELNIVQEGRAVLSPWKVMLAIVHYVPNFNLTSQQDAEEAFSHILSSLREEFSVCYVPNLRSLAVVTDLDSCRIFTPKGRAFESEQERWRRSFLGPIDGILSSILTCQSCSFQISLDFQYFHSLYLSPVIRGSDSIMPGMSVEDCLRQFFVAERVENYCCSQCWHAAAIKYLSLLNENEMDIQKLRSCNEQDSCDCKNISLLGAMPWSNSFSRTFKQLHIAHSPKILCLNLQRSFVNMFGQIVKLQGHISFTLTLNLSRFLNSGVEIKNYEETLGRSPQRYQRVVRYANHPTVQLDTTMPNSINEQLGKGNLADESIAKKSSQVSYDAAHDKNTQAVHVAQRLPDTRCCSDATDGSPMLLNDKVGETWNSSPVELHVYRLVSVVEHFGVSGSGHYTLYRRVGAKLEDGHPTRNSDFSPVYWFRISDHEVYSVSEEDVLAADASLLFYEKISES